MALSFSRTIALRSMAIALMAFVTLSALIPQPAAAATNQVTGTPGTTSLVKALGKANPISGTNVNSGSITANRSTATTGNQYITIKWRLWRWQGSGWTLLTAPSVRYLVKPGQYLGITGWNHTDNGAVGAWYSTDIRVTWEDAYGRVIGTRFHDFVNAGDYQCGSPLPQCQIGYAGSQYGMFLYPFI